MAMDLDLYFGRVEAEQQLTDRCVITREGGEMFNPETGLVETTTIEVWAGKCSLRSGARDGFEKLLGGRELDEGAFVLKLPVKGTGVVRSNDLVEITASADDDALVGARVRVTRHHYSTHSTLRRLVCKEVTGA